MDSIDDILRRAEREPIRFNGVPLMGIRTVWMFIASNNEGMEGCPFVQVDELGPIPQPMIATDQARLAVWRQVAQGVAQEIGCKITLYRFGGRTADESYEPDPTALLP